VRFSTAKGLCLIPIKALFQRCYKIFCGSLLTLLIRITAKTEFSLNVLKYTDLIKDRSTNGRFILVIMYVITIHYFFEESLFVWKQLTFTHFLLCRKSIGDLVLVIPPLPDG
jgi:hypothetical protein